MLLLKSENSINNALRFLISLPARIVMFNNYTRIGLFFILFAVLANKGFAQTGTGTCTDPILIDLSAHADTTFTRSGDTRTPSLCCNVNANNTCVSYRLTLNPGTDLLSIIVDKPKASEFFYIDCKGDPATGNGYAVNTPA